MTSTNEGAVVEQPRIVQLNHAVARGDFDHIVRLIKETGIGVDDGDENGVFPLLVAAQQGRRDVVEFLAKKKPSDGDKGRHPSQCGLGADVNKADPQGTTALILAAKEGHKEVVEALTDAAIGADIDVEDKMGLSAAFHASLRDHHGVVKVLKELGAKDAELLDDEDKCLAEAQSNREKGQAFFQKEDFRLARSRFVRSLALISQISDPKQDVEKKMGEIALSCKLNLSSCAIKLSDWEAAVINANDALKHFHQHPKALFRRGQARRQLRDFEAARRDLQKANELTGGDAGVQAELDALTADEAQERAVQQKKLSKMFQE